MKQSEPKKNHRILPCLLDASFSLHNRNCRVLKYAEKYVFVFVFVGYYIFFFSSL